MPGMRGIVLAVALCACRGGFDEVPAPPAPIEPRTPGVDGVATRGDLALWYELDDVGTDKRVLDISGNEMHGLCRTTCPAIVEGYVAAALDFSPLTIIDIPKLEALDTFTVAGWIWLPANSPLQCPLRSTLSTWRVCVSPTEARFSTGTHTLQVTTSIATARWVHIAVAWDGTMKSLYVDGRLAGSVAAAGTTFAQQLWIGAFLGHIDDLKIYRRALAPAEVDALYTEIL